MAYITYRTPAERKRKKEKGNNVHQQYNTIYGSRFETGTSRRHAT
jgi:hypothetical protein